MQDRITKLTDLWYSIVSLDHHKDRDCHWYINKAWSYGKEPIYRVEHYGYIYHDVDSRDFDNYDDAEEELYNLIVDAIDEEREWAKKVLVESETDNWDKYQIENASKILNLIDESRDN